MAKDKPKNPSASVRQRLLNHSTAIKTDPNPVLIWDGLERFLYRLSVSSYSERFVLKGDGRSRSIPHPHEGRRESADDHADGS
jgi:hypothetical protein